MTTSIHDEPWPPIDLEVDLTDAELDTRSRATQPASGLWPSLGVATVFLGGVACLAGSFLAQALHATRPRDPTVFVILSAAFALGIFVEVSGAAWVRRRKQRDLREEQRDRGVHATVRFTRRGVRVRRSASYLFRSWSAFTAVEVTRGLVLLFAEPGEVVAVPRRLLTTEQFARVVGALVFEDSG